MVGFPSPDRYDIAVILSSIIILAFAYGIYPTELVLVSSWLVVFTLYVCWMGYLAYKWTYDEETPA